VRQRDIRSNAIALTCRKEQGMRNVSMAIASLAILATGILIGAVSAPARGADPVAQLEVGPGASIRGPVTFRRPDGSVALRIASEVVFGEVMSFH
jgi:hypothetical protein